MISMSYKKLPMDLKPGNAILCSDGTITLTVLSCDPQAGTVRCRCENTAMLGDRKNVNLPGVVVDLPTLTEKDKEDILGWGVANNIDMIALSFVRKGSDLVNVRKLLGPHAKRIQLMSKVSVSSLGLLRINQLVLLGLRLCYKPYYAYSALLFFEVEFFPFITYFGCKCDFFFVCVREREDALVKNFN